MFFPIALMNEIDHLKEWVPGVTASGILKNLSIYRKVIHAKRDFPWPFANREFYLSCAAIILAE